MYEETKKAPAIRFQGFTDDWEQRKLGEVFFQTSKYVNPKESNLELWSLTVENGLTPKTERYNREFLVKKEDQFKSVDHNEFIYNPMNMTLGAVDLNLTGKTVAVSGYYITMLSKDGFDSKYFSIWLKSPLAIKMYKLYATGSLIERQRVQFPTLSQIKSSVPQIEEQTKIGSFFKQLDDTIALHQRQLNKYNDLKRTMLRKMFPNNDERAPQVRFDGFTGDWERRKFGDLWRKSSERNSDLKYTSQNVLSVAQMKLNPVERNSTDDYMKTYNVLYYGDIAFEGNKSKNYSFGRFVLNDVQDGIVSHVFISFKPKVEMNINFMKIYINNENVMKHHLVKATTKTLMMTTLNVHDMNKQFLVIPNIDEQAKIGMFFKKLDDNIALHQKKINKYNCLKKSFLQGMFV